MKSKLPALAVKEAFFQEYLVPAGQLAELYGEQLKKHCKWANPHLAQLLFDNLGLVSIFAISPATAPDPNLFSALSEQVGHLKATLTEDLLHLNVAKPDHKRVSAFCSAARTLAERVNPHIAALRTCMNFSDKKRGAWLKPLVEKPTALTQNGRYGKWRTLVRNMDFQTNMSAHGLAALAERVSLGSHTGREALPDLWRSLFHSSATPTAAGASAQNTSGYLPSGITVQSNNVGALVVACRFDPKRALKTMLAEVSTSGVALPAEMDLRLEQVDFAVLCGFHELPATVEEAIRWKASQMVLAEETSRAIVEFQKADKLAKARVRLQQSLSAEDLELLAEAGDLALRVKPASKAPASKAPTRTPRASSAAKPKSTTSRKTKAAVRA